MPSDSKEHSPLRGNLNLGLGVQFTGEAKGSQTLLLVYAILSCFLLLVGIGSLLCVSMLGWSALAAATIALGLGTWLVTKVFELWRTSQPIVDTVKGEPLQGAISVTQNGFSISGADNSIFSLNIQTLALTLAERVFCQKPLPVPSGEIIGSAANPTSIREYSPLEAETIHNTQSQELQAHIGEAQRQLQSLKPNFDTSVRQSIAAEVAVHNSVDIKLIEKQILAKG